MGDGDALRRRSESLPRRGASRSRRRCGKPYIVTVDSESALIAGSGIRSGFIGAKVAVTHVLPASESDEVLRVWCAYISAVQGGRALWGSATGTRRNKIHMVLRHLPKRDVGIVLDSPFSRPSA
jgi:hypothetical protein